MVKIYKCLNLIFFVGMIVINVLANTLPLGLGNTGEISNRYPNLFTPAPITFSIWGVIYILLAIFIVYQFGLFGNMAVSDTVVRLVGPWFILSCIMNICWIFTWHYDYTGLSMVFMLGLLVTLIFITSRLTSDNVIRITDMLRMPLAASISVIAFEIYVGWICVATIANLSALLVKVNWNRFGMMDQFWTIVMLIIGAIIGAIFVSLRSQYMSAVAIMWAYCGVLIKHISRTGGATGLSKAASFSDAGVINVVGFGGAGGAGSGAVLGSASGFGGAGGANFGGIGLAVSGYAGAYPAIMITAALCILFLIIVCIGNALTR